MRIALVYDCLYPCTIGGAERWYRLLAEDLARDSDVTYLTLRQWQDGVTVDLPKGVDIIGFGNKPVRLYDRRGRRRILPALHFGMRVLAHLARHRGRYDVIHCASFPYFSLLACRIALLGAPNTRLICDWHEVWTRRYWQEYLGRFLGLWGYAVQRLCVRTPARGFVFSHMNERLLDAQATRQKIERLPGLVDDKLKARAPIDAADPARVVFFGRHIPEKRVTTLPETIALVRQRVPDLVATVFGDGPDRQRLIEQVELFGLGAMIECPGFVPREELERVLASSLCLILPSQREGYGMAVVEAAAHGVPSVVASSPTSAATELIEPGINGLIARSAQPHDLAAAIIEVVAAGDALRMTTARWFSERRHHLLASASIKAVRARYRD